MNKISDKEIIDYLEVLKNYIAHLYSDKLHGRFGIFTFGLVNYGFARSTKDIDAIVVYVPTFEEISTSVTPVNFETQIASLENTVKVIDVRYFYEYAINQSAEVLEVLITDYYIIDERYRAAFEKLRESREKILHYNEGKRIQCACNQAIISYQKWKLCGDAKDAFNLMRLSLALHFYRNGHTCEDCVKIYKNPIAQELLEKILNGNIDELEIKLANEEITQIIKDTSIEKNNIEAEHLFKLGIFEIVKAGIDETINLNIFLAKLTSAELAAMRAVFAEVSAEGNIVISKMIEKTGISRPVFNNLIVKLKEDKVAEVTNQGVKGTKIKFIHQDLIRYLETSC